jgi:hypothetical protein
LSAWISPDAGDVSSYVIQTTIFTPPFLLALAHRIARPLFDVAGTLDQWKNNPLLLRAELQACANLILGARATYQSKGMGPALQDLRDGAGYTLANIAQSLNYFDVAVQFIVNHEAAHVYVGQFARMHKPMSNLDRKAFEFLADLTATSWLYRQFVVNTPHTREYLELRGHESRDESIRANTDIVLQGQLLVLTFLGLAEALRSNGRISMDGGRVHPHTMLRYMLQQTHFLTLVLSNFESAYPAPYDESMDRWWFEVVSLLTQVGLVPATARKAVLDDEEFRAVRRAGELADELKVAELSKAAAFLRGLAAIQMRGGEEISPKALSLSLHLS